MTILTSSNDFRSVCIDDVIEIGDIMLIKQSIANGWARVVKVTRLLNTQIEVETINVIPTEDTYKWGVINPFKSRKEGFYQDWANYKRCVLGRKSKFYNDSHIRVGDTNDFNPSVLVKIIK